MPVLVVCPDCGASLSMMPDNVGRMVDCAKCGTTFEMIGETRAHEADAPPGPGDSWPREPAPPDLPSLFGRYRISKKLGQGGMGAVYLAQDTTLGRPVALKVPNFHLGSDPDVIERFRREARAAAGFHHPNFCPIYDFDQIDGTHFLAMAFIDGETLGSRVDRVRPMPAREAAEIVRNLALALAEAHDRGIIHRDLKPSNVMIDRRGTLIIMDFGLARLTGSVDADLTRTGAVLGTPAYMSPEQVRGTKHDLGPATDIYALGVILYELSTGRRPFEGSVMAIIGAVQHVKPPPPSAHRPDLDRKLEAICLKAMAKRIEDRYDSMESLAKALGSFANPPPARKRPVLLGVAGAFLLALLGVIVYVVTDRGTLKIEGFTPGLEIRVNGKEIRIEKAGEPITVRTGEHGLLITRGEVLVKAPKSFEVRRGEETVVTLELIASPPDPPKVVPTRPTSNPVEVAKVDPPTAPSATPPKVDPPPPTSTASREIPERRIPPAPSSVNETEITNRLGMKLKLIPAGEFDMGSDASDPDAEDDEKVNGKKHHVQIKNSFYLGTTEVTVGQFREFVKRSNYKTDAERDGKGFGWNEAKGTFEQDPKYTWRSPGFPQTDDHPVVLVSYNDGVALCEWLKKEEGQAYRLPTEAEWEYSCRAGQASRYWFGDDPEGLAKVGNVADGTAKDGFVFTAPVGHYRANEFGLFDMHGNVWEWCADWQDSSYYAKSPSADPLNSSEAAGRVSAGRVSRGGSWSDYPRYCRSADRYGGMPGFRGSALGFRVARVRSGP